MRLSNILLISIIFVSTAVAVPSWRGNPNTTYQEWTFDDDDNPAVPEFNENPYGLPLAEFSTTGSPDNLVWLAEADGHQGVWTGEPLDIELTIPNRPVSDIYKEIWLEVDFQGQIPAWSVTPSPVVGNVVEEISHDTSPIGSSQWSRFTVGWRIYPNPSKERICLATGPGTLIDRAAVDTICVPEPATVCLLALGVLTIMRRRPKMNKAL